MCARNFQLPLARRVLLLPLATTPAAPRFLGTTAAAELASAGTAAAAELASAGATATVALELASAGTAAAAANEKSKFLAESQ